jgi:hypothetical protein
MRLERKRIMNKLITAVAALVAFAATPVLAQEQEPARKFQVSPYVGAFLPTGDHRDVLDDAFLSGLTLSLDVHRYVSVVGPFGWAASQGMEGFSRDQDLDVFQYDLGVQGQYPIALAHGLTLKPFVGAGVGARTYEFRDLDLDSETDFVGYFSAGANVDYRAFTVGVTMRDYLSNYDGIGAEEGSSTRNDISLFTTVGVRF